MNFTTNLKIFSLDNYDSIDFLTYLYLLPYSFELKKKEELDIITPFFRDTNILIIINDEKMKHYLPIFSFFKKLKAKIDTYNTKENSNNEKLVSDSLFLNIFLSNYKYIIFFLLEDNNEFIQNIKKQFVDLYKTSSKNLFYYFNLDKNFFSILFILSILLQFYEVIKSDVKNIKIQIDNDILNKLSFLYNLINKDFVRFALNNFFVNESEPEV